MLLQKTGAIECGQRKFDIFAIYICPKFLPDVSLYFANRFCSIAHRPNAGGEAVQAMRCIGIPIIDQNFIQEPFDDAIDPGGVKMFSASFLHDDPLLTVVKRTRG